MSKVFELIFTGSAEQVFRFDPGRFYAVVEDRMTQLMGRLRAKIHRNLHGDVLRFGSGRLAASLSAVNVYREGPTITGELSVGDSVHEHGGTHPYTILATNKKALRMMLDGKETFRKMVHRKPAIKRSYFLSAIDGMEQEFVEGIREACIKGISEK